jgi:hypothetical protein
LANWLESVEASGRRSVAEALAKGGANVCSAQRCFANRIRLQRSRFPAGRRIRPWAGSRIQAAVSRGGATASGIRPAAFPGSQAPVSPEPLARALATAADLADPLRRAGYGGVAGSYGRGGYAAAVGGYGDYASGYGGYGGKTGGPPTVGLRVRGIQLLI